MSIIDTDKVSGNRSTPSLNSNDGTSERKAHNTYGNTLRRAGSAVKQFMRFAQGIIEAKGDDGKRSFFLGYEPTISSRPVIRIAKDGSDALTGEDDELVFNSENNVFKVALQGTATVIKPSGTFSGTVSVPHNLGYRPVVFAFVEDSGVHRPLPLTNFLDTSYSTDNGSLLYKVDVEVITETEVMFVCRTPQLAGPAAPGNYNTAMTFPIKYFLLQETAS